MDIAVVVAGYNRAESLGRLLKSIGRANYHGDRVTLVISLDKSGREDVLHTAESFPWYFGSKKVVTHAERLGLRRHILECGGHTSEFDGVIVLEDDLYVSPQFYQYAKNALEAYGEDPHIGGISLYNHLWNVNASRPFTAADDQNDVFFLQFAQSWGEAWSRKMWTNFMGWYADNSGSLAPEDDIPDCVSRWPESSWLKYYTKYMIRTGRYFVYPRVSLTTNFGEVGQHNQRRSADYQVPLQLAPRSAYMMPDFLKDCVRYDAFFEREGLGKFCHVADDDLCTDLYGTKRSTKRRYLLTSRILDRCIVSSYALAMRPHELNIINSIQGNDFYLYDMRQEATFPQKRKAEKNRDRARTHYDFRNISKKVAADVFQYYDLDAVMNKLKRIFLRSGST